MPLTEVHKKMKQREYYRQYYLAHRERKLEQNNRSARLWRLKYPERYRETQARCRERMRALHPKKSALRTCIACDEVKPHKARGMCPACYSRRRRHSV